MTMNLENGSFASVSEGAGRFGSMVVSLGTGPVPVTTTMIPAKDDSLFLRLAAEKLSTMNRGIAVVSSSITKHMDAKTAGQIITEMVEMVRNV